jgi:signal transduction histidine kinase
VDVRDDGIGLPDGWRTGVGIQSMRERVAELGGELVIEPCLPHGTRITARLPAQETDRPAREPDRGPARDKSPDV